MIDEVKLRKKNDEEINYMLAEPLQIAWTTFELMLTHVIQLLQCRLFARCPIYFIKHLEICFNFLHVCVNIKHGIMCTRRPTPLPFH
jgi:hypothetical protein